MCGLQQQQLHHVVHDGGGDGLLRRAQQYSHLYSEHDIQCTTPSIVDNNER